MLFTQNHAQFFDDNGNPLNGGVVKFFEPGTSTPKDVYSDGDLTTSIGSEVTLDSAGRAVIFLDGNYKVTLENSAGVVVKTVDDVNVQDDPVTLVLTNPSFETAGNSATDIPGWTRSAPSGVTVERVTTDNYHGAACLEITSDGTNAGYAETTDFISVSPGREYEVSFALESSSATVTNTVQVRWFDESQNLVSTTSVYNASSGNPTSFATQVSTATPPATARYAKIRAQLGATAGTTRFDDFGLDVLATNLDGTLDDNIIKNGGTTLPSILSDTKANRPAAGTEGRWFYAKDENSNGRLYRDDGSSYSPLSFGLERVLIWNASSQTIINSSTTEIQPANEAYDIGDMWDSGSPGDIVCPRDGTVVVTAHVEWESNTSGNRQLFFTINNAGVTYLPESEIPAGSSGVKQALSTSAVEVSASDVISAMVFQDSGGDLDVLACHVSLRYIE